MKVVYKKRGNSFGISLPLTQTCQIYVKDFSMYAKKGSRRTISVSFPFRSTDPWQSMINLSSSFLMQKEEHYM